MDAGKCVTYADVAKFYANKWDTDEVARDAYSATAKAVWYAAISRENDYEKYIEEAKKRRIGLDDAFFAWKLIKSRDNDGFDTVDIYNKNREEGLEFYEWFINRCNPIGVEKYYRPGQKWHLYEFILYKEMMLKEGENFPKTKATALKISIKQDRFDQYGKFIPELKIWMTNAANSLIGGWPEISKIIQEKYLKNE